MIDAVIDVPLTHKLDTDAADDLFIRASGIADEVWHMAYLDRSAWSFLSEVW